MKKISLVFIAVLLMMLSACSQNTGGSIFNGSRTGNDSQFIMNYTVFNTTDSQALNVKAGDKIHAEIVVEGGSLTYKIQNDDVIIVEGNDITASEEFDVKVAESGTYIVTVTGESAKGSVIFVVQRIE